MSIFRWLLYCAKNGLPESVLTAGVFLCPTVFSRPKIDVRIDLCRQCDALPRLPSAVSFFLFIFAEGFSEYTAELLTMTGRYFPQDWQVDFDGTRALSFIERRRNIGARLALLLCLGLQGEATTPFSSLVFFPTIRLLLVVLAHAVVTLQVTLVLCFSTS